MRTSQRPSRLRVILHADDLGISQHVNDAIFGLMAQGMINSASILCNSPAFDDAVRRTRGFPDCSFGVHLNLTQFHPLTQDPGLTVFQNATGRFIRKPLPVFLHNASQDAVVREWSCQVQRARDAGLSISHVDSHHHVHTRIGLLGCVRRVCQEHGIRRVRVRQTLFANRTISRCRLDNRLYNRVLRGSFICADHFGPFSSFAVSRATLPPGSSVELMIHPGHPSYAAEVAAMRGTVDDTFREQYECITYEDLP